MADSFNPATDMPGSAVDVMALHNSNPALSTRTAMTVARQTGLDPTDPKNVVLAMHSKAYQSRMQAGGAGGDPTAPENSDVPPPPRATPAYSSDNAKIDMGASPQGEMASGYQQKADAYQRSIDDNNKWSAMEQDAIASAGRMANFQKGAYIEKRMKEMMPTADIDQQILALRSKALYERASMYEEVKGLPWEMQQKAIQDRMNVYTQGLQDLQDFRTARIDDAKQKIGNEIDEYTGRAEASKTKLEGIRAAISTAKANGSAEESIAQLHIDAAKEELRLQKVRKSTGGLATEPEMINQSLLQSYRYLTGKDPTAAKKKELATQAQHLYGNGDTSQKAAWVTGGYHGSTKSDVDHYMLRQFLTQSEKNAGAEVRVKADKLKGK